MKLLVIGDPHGNLEKIKKIKNVKHADLILLTGDIGKADFARKRYFENVERKKKELDELEYASKDAKASYMQIYGSSMKVLRYLSKFAPVFTIFGNVELKDKDVKEENKKYELNLPLFVSEINKMKNVSIINNRFRNFKGVKILGLEYFKDINRVQDFKPKDYKKAMKSAKKQTAKAEKVLKRFRNLDILVHHQPPYGYLDKVGGMAPKAWQGKHAGSKTILNYIKKYQPKYAFCGHIHEGEGKVKIGKTEVYNLGVAGHKWVEF